VTPTRLCILLLLCNILFAIGLFAPCMTILPGFGEFTSLVAFLKPEFGKASTISIAEGIAALYSDGKYFIASVVLLFSVIFPLWKLGVLWASVLAIYRGESAAKLLKNIEKLGKFSMVDIFVIALIILAIKGLPGGTAVQLNWGVFTFTASVILSICLPHWFPDDKKKESAISKV